MLNHKSGPFIIAKGAPPPFRSTHPPTLPESFSHTHSDRLWRAVRGTVWRCDLDLAVSARQPLNVRSPVGRVGWGVRGSGPRPLSAPDNTNLQRQHLSPSPTSTLSHALQTAVTGSPGRGSLGAAAAFSLTSFRVQQWPPLSRSSDGKLINHGQINCDTLI